LGSRVQGQGSALGFRVQGLGIWFRVRVKGEVLELGFRVWGEGLWIALRV